MTFRTWHARTPDGREWEVRVRAFWVPEPVASRRGVIDVTGEDAVASSLTTLLVVVPIAAVRSIWSPTRYVEARCYWPAEIVITWRTGRRLAARHAKEIAERLDRGYEGVAPEGVEMVHMTRPPGLDDL